MTMVIGSIVLGAFTESQQVDDAIEQLQSTGFNNIKFAEPGGKQSGFETQRGFSGTILELFGKKGNLEGNIVSELVKMGVPKDEAESYRHQFQLGRGIIAVEAPDRQDVALEILRENGAFDAAALSATDDPNRPSS